MKQYLYIAQGSLEPSKCKIGITNDLNRRLKEYNSTTEFRLRILTAIFLLLK
ncbi:GIY-YIG nuclease family protein [Campylobacter upsaliensis]